jgi:lipoate-protein ligase A
MLSLCRTIIDPPAEGAWNMAVDEALLEAAADQGACYLRFYRWQPATLSLGYFQRHTDRRRHTPSRDCPLVRRQSGGGAIVHDAEQTYSLIVPHGHALAADAQSLYLAMHEELIATLAELGVNAALCRHAGNSRGQAEPFLCFHRRSIGDVLFGANKIAGSAQRRRQGAVLQHGSVVLAASPAAPDLPSLGELSGTMIDESVLRTTWTARLARRLNLKVQPTALEAAQADRAHELVKNKYGSARWTERR